MPTMNPTVLLGSRECPTPVMADPKSDWRREAEPRGEQRPSPRLTARDERDGRVEWSG